MTLAERIHVRMISDRRTRQRIEMIAPAAIEEIIGFAITALSEIVPMETHAHALTEIDFEACEGCGHLIDPKEPEGAVYGSEDGIWLCNACHVEAAEATP